jgi:hypothetical protein
VPFVQIVRRSRTCSIEQGEAEELIAELRRLPEQAYPDAVAAAVVIEGAMEATNATGVKFELGERQALSRVLEGWMVEEREFSDGLYCLRDVLRDEGD